MHCHASFLERERARAWVRNQKRIISQSIALHFPMCHVTTCFRSSYSSNPAQTMNMKIVGRAQVVWTSSGSRLGPWIFSFLVESRLVGTPWGIPRVWGAGGSSKSEEPGAFESEIITRAYQIIRLLVVWSCSAMPCVPPNVVNEFLSSWLCNLFYSPCRSVIPGHYIAESLPKTWFLITLLWFRQRRKTRKSRVQEVIRVW